MAGASSTSLTTASEKYSFSTILFIKMKILIWVKMKVQYYRKK
jgi:hypothetical protein